MAVWGIQGHAHDGCMKATAVLRCNGQWPSLHHYPNASVKRVDEKMQNCGKGCGFYDTLSYAHRKPGLDVHKHRHALPAACSHPQHGGHGGASPGQNHSRENPFIINLCSEKLLVLTDGATDDWSSLRKRVQRCTVSQLRSMSSDKGAAVTQTSFNR